MESFGLGLTLDTTLLEKADKTLENMQKNSQLIMQNLTRGFTAFSEGKISDFTKVFENMSKAMDKISKTTVSLDFDTSGLQKGLGYISQLTTEIEKIQRKGTKLFFNPNELYTTTESTAEVSSRLSNLYDMAEALGHVLKVLSEYPQKIREAENEIAKIDSLLKRTKAGSKKNTLYSEKKIDVETSLKKMREELAESKLKFGDLDAARLAESGLKEEIKITQQQLAWTKKTKAEQLAAITSYNNKIIADEKARTKEVETLYRNNFAEIQKISKAIAQLEEDREKIAKGGGDTSEQDTHLAFYRDQLQKRIELEEEITKSGYQKIAKIKEELGAKAFLDSSKQQLKDLQTEVSFANRFSKSAKSVEEERQAIELLRSARNNLSQDTAHYKRIVEALNKRILTHKDHIESVTREEKEQNTLSDSVINRYRKQLKALDDVNEALEKQMKIERKTSVADLDPTNADTKALLARQKTIADDIADIESNAQGQLDVIREQHEAERAKKKVDSILKENEREKQEYAKLLDEKYALEKQKRAMEDAGAKVGDKAYDNILKQEVDLNSRISQLREKHQNDLDDIDKRHAKKRNDDEVKAFIEAEKEKQRIAEETAKKMKEEWEKYGVVGVPEANAAIRNNRNAENIAQHKRAIEELQKVRSRLDNTDRRYYDTLKNLNREIHSHELFIRAAENESVRLGNSHRGLMDISGQLMRRLALVFSVSQITQYFRKLVEVRGQFEKTEVALTSIIQSQEKAKKLMNQTIALAIKSPFTLQQLTGYTKQLAAYQVEYKDLYNTTKMLADVSAGLGVEMDRLILAFGQVKAANYLRATEVRQFTEAGFNILGELAKYYSELEGTMVSVGDVQERVTKRMVDFADVEEIFHRVTEAGGMFYEMQSKQAETLAGQWTNLQDRIDVMLNEIGTSGDGVLKFIVKMLASAIDNWEVLASSIKTAATAFIIFKTYSLLAGDGMKLLAIQMGVLTDTVPKVLSLGQAFKTLGQAFKTLGKVVGSAITKIGASMGALLTKPVFLAVAAIGALVSAGVSLYRHLDKMKDALKEQSDSFNEYTSSLSKLSREFGKLDKFTEKLAKLEELKGRLNERGLALSVKIDEVDAENIDKIFAENSEILQKSYDLGLSVGNAITKGLNAAQGNVFGWSLFGENLAEDAEDFAEKWNKLASYGMDAQMTSMTNEIEATIASMNDMTEEERSAYTEMLKIYETIKDGRKAERDDKGKIIKYTESEYEWTIRRATALKQIQDLEDGSVTKNNKLARYLRQVARQERELNHEVENTVNKLAKEFGGLEKLMQAAKENPVEFSAAIQAEIDKQAWDDVTKWVYSQKLHARLDIEPNYVEDPSRTDSEKLAQFQQDLIDARANLEKKGKGYKNFFISEEEIKNMKFFSDGLEGIQKLYDENKKTIEQLEGTSDEYSKEELARLNALQKELEVVAEKWDYNLNEGKYEKGASRGVKILQKRIGLLKEVNQKYLELVKTFDADTAKEKVMDAYADTFREAFAGTGVDLDLYKVMTQVITDSKKVGEEMGSNLSEGVINKLKELEGAGTYIRSATEDIIEFTKAEEAFRPNAYLDKLANVWTIGYGTTSKAGIGVNVVEGMVIDQAKAEEWLLKTYKSKEQILNSILDKHKDLIITQEQYNALLDASYNGEGASKAIEFAYGSWEHFERYLNSLKAMKQANQKAVVVDVEEIKKEWEALDTIQEKLALTLKWSGIRTDGKVSSALQDRAIKRAEMFSGDLDIANQLETVLVRIAGMDFTTTEGLIEALGKLKEIAEKEGPEAKNILSQAISGLEAEIGVRLKEDADKKLKDEVQSLFDRYELTVDLKKLNLPKGVAEDLFNTEYLDLKGLRQAVTERESEFVGTDQEEEYKKFLEKIDEMERKDIVERTKTYVEYLKRGMNERIKLKVEELRRLKELEESKEFSNEQKAEIRKQIQIDSNKELDKQQWDRFRGTELYIMMFEDLEVLGTQSIKNLYDHLEKLKANLSHLDASEVKEIVNQMEKLQEEMISRNPFEAFRKAQKDIRSVGEDEQTLLDRLFNKEKIEAEAQSIIDSISTIERAFADSTFEQLRDDDKALFESFMPQFAEGKDLAAIKKYYQDKLDSAKKDKELTDAQLKNFADYRKALQGISDYWGEMNGQVQNIIGSVKEIMGALGADEISMALADSVGNMSTLVLQAVQFGVQMQIAGYASNMALGVIGWIAIAIQAIATVISAIANVENARIDAQLKQQAKLIERQRDLYEEIEERVNKAYDVGQLRQYNAEMKRSVDLEIQALEASIALERSRKNADEEQIEDWQKEIDEARKKLAESAQEMAEKVGGIFDVEDFTSGFIDAWWDAMEEGMDGLDALNDHFEETMKDMVKKQALYKGAQKIMEPVIKAINEDLEGDYEIDDWQKILDVAKEANVDLDAFLQGWYEMFGGLSDGASGGLSALQKGIQGMNESQAEILTAYWNSVRQYTANIDSKMDLVLANMNVSSDENPMLEQIRTQTGYLQTIKDVLSGASSFEARAIWVKLAGQK